METRDGVMLRHPDPLHEIRTRTKVINEYFNKGPDVYTEIETRNVPSRESQHNKNMLDARYGHTPTISKHRTTKKS